MRVKDRPAGRAECGSWRATSEYVQGYPAVRACRASCIAAAAQLRKHFFFQPLGSRSACLIGVSASRRGKQFLALAPTTLKRSQLLPAMARSAALLQLQRERPERPQRPKSTGPAGGVGRGTDDADGPDGQYPSGRIAE